MLAWNFRAYRIRTGGSRMTFFQLGERVVVLDRPGRIVGVTRQETPKYDVLFDDDTTTVLDVKEEISRDEV